MSSGPDIPELTPVFPLKAVLFPRAEMPLHIFEPRYRAMTADAMAGERFIAIALLRPGYDNLYHTLHAPIHPTIGVGRITMCNQLSDGRYALVLRGVARAMIIEELPGRPYRFARVEAVGDRANTSESTLRRLRIELRDAVTSAMQEPRRVEQLRRLCDGELPLAALTDCIASRMPFAPPVAQVLLEEGEVAARARRLIDHLKTLAAVVRNRRRQWAGQMSSN
ncbi:MAG: LON peptidase substrate-binding domain-containing protein [Phycisphaerales bacterium]|nr:LON peptidase substrate-binding domain-containing protein [Phycisphaerales bacterium]